MESSFARIWRSCKVTLAIRTHGHLTWQNTARHHNKQINMSIRVVSANRMHKQPVFHIDKILSLCSRISLWQLRRCRSSCQRM